MKTISPESFAMLCFLVLMQNGSGIKGKSPDHIAEKTVMLREGYNAFSYLDYLNMQRVVNYCSVWKIELTKSIVEEMQRQNDAARELNL